MPIRFKEKEEILAIARARQHEIEELISKDTSASDRFIPGLDLVFERFVDLCGALSVIGGGVASIKSIAEAAFSLLRWVRSSRSPNKKLEAGTLRERVLVLLFDAHTRGGKGLSLEHVSHVTGADLTEVQTTLTSLKSFKVARKTPAGLWRYVVQDT